MWCYNNSCHSVVDDNVINSAIAMCPSQDNVWIQLKSDKLSLISPLQQHSSQGTMQFKCSCSEIWSLANGNSWFDGILIMYMLAIIQFIVISRITQHLTHWPSWKDLLSCFLENLASGWSLSTSLSLITLLQISPLEMDT